MYIPKGEVTFANTSTKPSHPLIFANMIDLCKTAIIRYNNRDSALIFASVA